MSIAPLVKVTFVGHDADRERVLQDLQGFGCLHLLPLRPLPERPGTPNSRAYEALHFLLSCPRRRRQVTRGERFDAFEVERRALEVRDRLQDLKEEADGLLQRIEALLPWGDFTFPPLEEMDGRRLWFYVVPERAMKRVEAAEVTWERIGQADDLHYLVVISPEEPRKMPVARELLGNRSRHALERRLEDVEIEIDDLQAERSSLSRWSMLFSRRLDALEDTEERERAAEGALVDAPLFGLEAWAPSGKVGQLEAYARERGLSFESRPPEPVESPPTLLENPPELRAGEGLVTFYSVPGYRSWDPSPIVLFSFALFFAMILSDAGYGLILAAIAASTWKRLAKSEALRRIRSLLALLAGSSVVYGVLAGSYCGLSPPTGSLLATLAIIDIGDTESMLALSVVVGVAHIVAANVMNARRLGRRPEALAPLGWAVMITAGLLAVVSSRTGAGTLEAGAFAAAGAGALMVLFFSGAGKPPLSRALGGLLALTKVTSAFGDTLSYLRLFALGLASASLAAAFNDMAGQVRHALPGVGLMLALAVLLLGHGLNFVLCVSSAVIHGLRLNVIEFFNWGLTEEGSLFRPFRRKETEQWTR